MRHLLWMLLLAGSPVFAAEAYPEARLSVVQDAGEDGEETVESWLVDANMAADTGRYAAAKLDFKKAIKEDPAHQAAARGLAEVYVQTGDYKLAQKALESCITAAEKAGTAIEPRTRIALARILFTRGEYSAVEKIADTLIAESSAEATAATPRSEVVLAAIDGAVLKGNLLRTQGLYDDAVKLYATVRDMVMAHRGGLMRIDTSKKRQADMADLWCSAGEAYYWQNKLHEANDCWGNALQADEYHLRTAGWMARLYLEQNHDSSSRVNYSEPTLRHNPNVTELKLRLAEAHFFRWRSGEGMKHLEEGLKVNPDHPEALSVRALRFLYTDQYEEARKDYERALKVNPQHVEALGAKALHGKTLGLKDVFEQAEAAMLAINPKPARFYEIVADGLSDRFRYVEAFPMYDKALACNEKHWSAYKGRGMAAMNFGDDVLGKKSLKTAFDNDPLRNNLQTLNLLTLLESYKNFERYESPDGRWRLLVHKTEAPVMKDLYIQHLDACWDSMTRKYDFKPRTPIVVEAFHRHEDFEVRTVGITGLPALGACFGQLITLDSPGARPAGSYNWASTLRHEMDHVFQLQISNGQIPRWLAEGSSVYEEKMTRPEWERHMEDQLFMHYHMDDIPSVKKFNEWFRDGSKVLFAYYLGNVMLEFIDKKLGGLGSVRKMIEMFGEKKTPEEVFRACLNMEPEAFDQQFRSYVRDERIAHLRMVPRISQDRVTQLYFKYEDGKADVRDMVELALGYAQQGSRVDAETFIGLASRKGIADELSPTGARFHYVKMLLARGDEKLNAAQRAAKSREHLETAIARGLEDFQSFLIMAQFAQREQNQSMMLHWLKEANRAFPENPQPYAAMYQYWQQAGNREMAVEAAENWMKVDENNLQLRMWLIEQVYDPGRNWVKMAEMADQAVNIAPLMAGTHRYRAFALRKLKRYEEAVQSFEYVRRLATGNTPEEAVAAEVNALLDIAATWLHAEKFDKCREALEKAKLLDPKNERIKTIQEELEAGEKEKEEGF